MAPDSIPAKSIKVITMIVARTLDLNPVLVGKAPHYSLLLYLVFHPPSRT